MTSHVDIVEVTTQGVIIGFRHSTIGPVHEAVVSDDDPATLVAAIAHERDTCRAPRFVIDLTALDSLGESHLDVLTTEMRGHPDDEWVIRLSESAASGNEDLADAAPVTVVRRHKPV